MCLLGVDTGHLKEVKERSKAEVGALGAQDEVAFRLGDKEMVRWGWQGRKRAEGGKIV